MLRDTHRHIALRPLPVILLLCFGVAGASCGVPKAMSGPDAADGHDAAAADPGPADAAADLATDVTPLGTVDGGADGSDATDTGMVPGCGPNSVATAEATGYVRDENGNLVGDALDETVVVIRIEDAVIATPPATTGVPGRRLVVESAIAPHPRWELQLLIPDLPADLVKQGDTLRMFLAAKPAGAFAPHTVSQTLVLTGVDGLVLFTANLWAGATPAPTTKASIPAVPFNLLPDLGRWGVQLLDAGPLCTSLVPAGDLCPLVRRVVSATWMGKSGTAPSGATLDLGSLRLFVGRLDHVLSEGGCDGFSNTRLAGFVAAAP